MGVNSPAKTDLLRSEIIANDFLQTLANSLFGDGIKVTLGENRVNDLCVLFAGLWRDYCTKLAMAMSLLK